jgi:hypothetical protein
MGMNCSHLVQSLAPPFVEKLILHSTMRGLVASEGVGGAASCKRRARRLMSWSLLFQSLFFLGSLDVAAARQESRDIQRMAV